MSHLYSELPEIKRDFISFGARALTQGLLIPDILLTLNITHKTALS